MKWTLVASSAPQDGDAVYNTLRLAQTAHNRGHDVRLFFINDAVDAVRRGFGAQEMRDLLDGCIRDEIPVKICTTCLTRCGIDQSAVRDDVTMAAMSDLAEWIEESDRVLTF